jgi:hypothetical protein
MTALWRNLPWHPIVLTAVIVVGFWMDAIVSPYAAFRGLVIALVGAALFTAMMSLILRSRHAGGLAVSALIAVLYSKHLVRLIVDLGPQMPPPVLVLWLLAMLAGAGLVARIVIRASRRLDWLSATSLMNRIALILLVASIATGLLNGKLARGASDLQQGGGLESTSPQVAENELEPDIYVVMLDGYPREDVLDFAFGYDNKPFVRALEQRGFAVAGRSHSDYLWTHLSLTSLFHMAFVEDIPVIQEIAAGMRPIHPGLFDAVNNNPVFDVAHSHSYQVVAIGGGFEQLTPRKADVYLDRGEMNDYELGLLNSTYLGQVLSFFAPTLASGQHADRIRSTLRYLGEVARAPHSQPRLVFAHVPTPHQPTVFRSDGETIPVPIDNGFYADSPVEKGVPIYRFIAQYRDHLGYLNGLILESLDEVLAESDRPPVIVFFSDHGSASRVNWATTRPADADPKRLAERTGSFLAALTPGKTDVFPDDPSPASIFRYLFDSYFGTSYGRAVPPPNGGQVPPVDPSVLQNP